MGAASAAKNNNKPAARRRGRPVADDTEEDETLKARRRRNREAQHVFRKRRQAAEAAQSQRVQRLEGLVEQMSSVFTGFVDEMLATETVVRQCPGLVRSLQGSTARMLKLAHEVVELDGEGDAAGGGDSADHDAEQDTAKMPELVVASDDSWRSELAEEFGQTRTPASLPSLEASYPNDGYDFIASIEGSIAGERRPDPSDTLVVNYNPPTDPELLDDALAIADDALTYDVISAQASFASAPFFYQDYGTDWSDGFALGNPKPSLAARLSPHSFLFRLTEATVTSAYRVLTGPTWTARAEERIFQRPLKPINRDQKLFRMRWLLGPGRLDMHIAVDPPVTETTFEDGFDADNWITAAGVQRQLQSLGAKMVGTDTLEVHIDRPDATLPPPALIKNNALVAATFPSTQSAAPHLAWCLPEVFPNSADAAAAASAMAAAATRTLTMRLSLTLLIANLTTVAKCFARGPRYNRQDVCKMVAASAIQVSEGDPAAVPA